MRDPIRSWKRSSLLVACAVLGLLGIETKAEIASPEGLRRRCDMSLAQAESIYRGADRPFSGAELPIALMCAAETLIEVERHADGERLLLEAVASSASNPSVLGQSLGELGKLYARQRRVQDLKSVWDRLAALQTTDPEHADRLVLVEPILRIAEDLFRAGDHSAALELAERVETYHGGDGYGVETLDPIWLPDLYAAVGRQAHAEKIHQARLRAARQGGEPLEVARRMSDYANYLEAQGRHDEASAKRDEANQLRQKRLSEIASPDYWREQPQ